MSAALIAKLESASEGSRELDCEIWAHFQPEIVKIVEFWACYREPRQTSVSFTIPPKRTEIVTNHVGPYLNAEPVTTSIDAALALAGLVLGDEEWMVTKSREGGTTSFHAILKPEIFSQANTPALAICAAILRASAAEGAGT